MERQLATPRRPGLAGRAAEAEVGLPLGGLRLLHCGYAVSPFALAGAAGTFLEGARPQASSSSYRILAKQLAHHPNTKKMSSDTTPNPLGSQNAGTEEIVGTTTQAAEGGRPQKGTDIQAAGRTIATSKKSRLSTVAERQQSTTGPGDEESNPEEENNADEVLGLLRAAPTKRK
ncbi:hypothetical protein PGT21_011531 [Puccinia graminis f. sp. tritici]|uniref:Uncharacterized protein n=1 Tax=Puccinia graminis f. sp. tritici TaxID=56615 RepID=A0A5B0S461_PUCGR|nr:hypothetical protein PGT21_011531 [Puccinia graminis f. sp. tritici]KAA1132145.1 hypothetical protein PGTUg99_037454 [Puccinia graminis f. sp. tritici]